MIEFIKTLKMAEKDDQSPQVEAENEMSSLQHEIQRLTDAHAEALEACEMERLEEEIETRETILTNLQEQPHRYGEEDLRRSTRPKILTHKMLDLLKEEAKKKERKLVSMYERWKIQARESRKQLKMDLSESELSSLVETLEKEREAIMSIYFQIRDHITVSTELRRRVDACDAVTTDIRKIAYERLTGIDGDFDAEQAQRPLKELLKRSCAHSIYGSTV